MRVLHSYFKNCSFFVDGRVLGRILGKRRDEEVEISTMYGGGGARNLMQTRSKT
jgi:hypothetical protein